MLKTRIIPCLLLRNWGIEKSIRFRDHVYIGSPINAARVFNGRNVDELILLDIAATAEQRGPNPDIVAQIAEETCMPLTVGGGVRCIETVRELMSAGADRVVINTAAHEKPALLTEAAELFGRQCVVAAIDVKQHDDGRYEVFTHGGTQPTGRDPIDWARQVEQHGAGEVLLTSIDRDGTMSGFDIALVRQVADALDIPLIACGGAGSVADLASAVHEGHASAVAAGAFFLFYGRRRTVLITYPTDEELLEHFHPDEVRRKGQPRLDRLWTST